MSFCIKNILVKSLIVGIVIIFSTSYSQGTFERTYGGSLREFAYDCQQTHDSSYIIVGVTRSFGAGGDDVWLVKIDTLGDTLWTKTYGGIEDDGGRAIRQTADGGYIIAGHTAYGIGFHSVYVIRTDSLGDTLWTRAYGEGWNDYGWGVCTTSDDGYLITGSTEGLGNTDLYIIKLDSLGDSLWTRIYGGTGIDVGKAVLEAPNGNYMVVGHTFSFGPGDVAVWLLSLDNAGDTLWTRLYGENGSDCGKDILATNDGGFLIAGETNEGSGQDDDVYIIRTDSLGDTLWTRKYGGNNWDMGESVCQLADGSYVIGGATRSYGAGNYDVWLIKIDSVGNMLWSKTFGGTSYDYGHSIALTNDAGFIASGYTYSFGAGNGDMYVIKTDSTGSLDVEENRTVTNNYIYTYTTIFNGPLQFPTDKPFKIFDITGRQIYTINPTPGIYFIEIEGKIRQKIVKVR